VSDDDKVGGLMAIEVYGPRIDAPMAQRLDALTALATEQLADEPEARIAWLLCDGCDWREGLDPADAKLPDGWTVTVLGDYCPQCSAIGDQ
jgi:hypothetical protein